MTPFSSLFWALDEIANYEHKQEQEELDRDSS
jgi:hypothetical protein